MKGKKIASFLLLRPAFTQRNFTTILLVGVFIAVYSFAGGKVTLQVPDVGNSTKSFGSVESVNGESAGVLANAVRERDEEKRREQERAAQVLGMRESEDKLARENALNERGKLFDPAMDADSSDSKLDPQGLLGNDAQMRNREEQKLRRNEKRSKDSLALIEERLKINRGGQ